MRADFTYAGALRLLAERQETQVRLGLGRVRRLLARLGDPQEAYPAVHVAGTNGKGSTCAMLDSVLREAGHRVGLYTSPHLSDVRERIRVGGRPIGEAAFARVLSRVAAAEAATRGKRNSARRPLTYFELLTAAAFLHFRDERVGVAVLETGLGGRLDATNVVRRPLACLIPAVDLDHTDWLGKTLSAVAREKAGIFKRGSPALTAETKPAPLRVLRAAAARLEAPWRELGPREGWRVLRTDWRQGRQLVGTPDGKRLAVGLLGSAQPRNAALVAASLEALREGGLRVRDGALARGLARVRWPGRFEVLRRGGRTLILDGAHNPQAMGEFCRTLEASPWARSPKLFVVGMLADKDYRAMARRLGPHLTKAVAVEPSSPRALPAGLLAEALSSASPRARITAAPSPASALEAWRANGSTVACVVGSFYLVGRVRRLWGLS